MLSLYAQNGDRIVAIDFVTSLHPMYSRVDHGSGPSAGRVTKTEKTSGSGRVGSDGSGFGDIQFATAYNNGITYVINALSMLVGSGRQFRVQDGSGRVGSPTQRVGSGPEKSDPWSTLMYSVARG